MKWGKIKNWGVKMLLTAATMIASQAALARISKVSATSDSSNVYYSYSYSASANFYRVYLDTDRNAGTGYSYRGMGANYLIENGALYKYSGSNGGWGWSFVVSVTMTHPSSTSVRFVVARSSFGNPSALNLIANTSAGDNSAIIYQSLASTATTTTSTSTTTTIAPTTTLTSTTTTIPPPTTTMAPTTTTTTLPYTKPALINPVSPISYGAKCDGVTDDSAAFAAALRASDVLVPAGRVCVINQQVQVSTNNRHLECGSGTILKMTVTSGKMFNYIAPSGSRLSGDSIVNCHFIGANTEAPQADWNDPGKHFNIPVETQDRVDNFYLAGNTFERFWGQSMFQTYGAVDGGHGDQIIYNTFRSCGLYGPVFTAHQNGLIANNTMLDCAAGVENDDATQYSGGNIIEHNTLTCKYGYGGADMGACTMLTGGATANGADYTTNIVRYNSISGVSNGLGYQPAEGSRLVGGASWGAKAAQYISNTCGPGCVYTP